MLQGMIDIGSNTIRMAIYEIRNIPETPVNVVVSEAVNLAQKYSGTEDSAFINGVLGAYSRSLPEGNAE